MMQLAKNAALLVVVLACAGCYGYAPVQTPRPGMDVRARLTAEAAARRSQGLDDPVVRLDGTVVEATPTAVSLDILVARATSVFQDVMIRDTVRLETVEIQSLYVRKFSPAKTALVTVGAGLAMYAIVKGIDQIVGGTEGDPDPGNPPTTFRDPAIRIGFRLLRFE